MRAQRFFTSKHNIDEASSTVSLDEPALISQIRNVLRLRTGDTVFILDGEGSIYRCRLSKLNRDLVTAAIESKDAAGGEPAVSLTVALPLLRSGRFEWALEKLTELGASKVIPTVCARSVVRTTGHESGKRESDSGGKLARWRAIVREAAEQCERATIPQVVEPIDFSALIEMTQPLPAERRIVCVERSDAPLLTHLLHSRNILENTPADMVLIVGPEGGFNDEELRMVADTTFTETSLGPLVLRTETAAIYATALIISHCRVDK
jgi:16S rRNA (uracil1498-N3)-methyltransferase